MRERFAKILAALTAVIVVALAATFSAVQNSPREASKQATATIAQAPSAGRAAYERNGCGGCHAIRGSGNRRNPLDGVGARRSREELRDWIVAADSVRPQLSASVASVKQSYAALPAEELDALVDYLASLKMPVESIGIVKPFPGVSGASRGAGVNQHEPALAYGSGRRWAATLSGWPGIWLIAVAEAAGSEPFALTRYACRFMKAVVAAGGASQWPADRTPRP